MMKKIFHTLIFILVCLTGNSQKDIGRYYADLDLYQFSGLNEITETSKLTGRRYIKLDYNNGVIRKIGIYESGKKSYSINVSEENGFRILSFPKRTARRYEGNWLVFKNRRKTKAEWQIGNDSLFIINASKKKSQGASATIIKLNRNDSLLIKSYSVCCLDINADRRGLAKRQYLLNRISTDASITWHSYNLNFDKNILYSHRTNSTMAEDGASDGKPLTEYFSSAGGSLFWLLVNYW